MKKHTHTYVGIPVRDAAGGLQVIAFCSVCGIPQQPVSLQREITKSIHKKRRRLLRK